MYTFLIVIHLIISFSLIFIVLLQTGKEEGLGAFGGGPSHALIGGRGTATFLHKLTTGLAIAFMVSSLLLAITTTQMGKTSSVISGEGTRTEQSK